MRPSKNQHLIAILRSELGLGQEEIADRVGVHKRTIQNIELGRRPLSPSIARKISEQFDLHLDSLLANDLTDGLRTRSGRPWSNRTRLEQDKRLKRWGDLEPVARIAQRGISHALLNQYLEISHLLRQLPGELEDVLYRWTSLFYLAVGGLIESDGQDLKGSGVPDYYRLETVLDDVQAVRSDLRILKRYEAKREKRNGKDNDKDYESRRAVARLFGYNDRGLTALEVLKEIGREKYESMRLVDFRALVRERCKTKSRCGKRLILSRLSSAGTMTTKAV